MRKFLISYHAPSKFGRFFNTRDDDSAPSESDILAMEEHLSKEHGTTVLILAIAELATDKPAEPELGPEEEGLVELTYASNGRSALELHRVRRDAEGRICEAYVIGSPVQLKANHDLGSCWLSCAPEELVDISRYTGWTKP